MDRCPVCRARWSADDRVCRRCEVDLTTALAVEQQAADCERFAVARLESGDLGGAREAVQQALQLKRTVFAQHLRGLIKRLSRQQT